MKVDILKENLTSGLSKANRIISSRSQLPILANILLEATNNQLILYSTNLETSIKIILGAKVEKKGSFTVPAKLFSEFINSLPAEKVKLELAKNQLIITCNKYKATINGLESKDYPQFPSTKKQPFLSLDAKNFSQIIAQVAFAATFDDSRPVLNGICLVFDKTRLSFAATDGYRLSVKKIASPPDSDQKIIIPASSLQEVQKIISEGKDSNKKIDISQTEDKNQLIFQYNDVYLATRLIGGEFPEYEKIIPDKKTTSVSIDKEELYKAVKVASIFTKKRKRKNYCKRPICRSRGEYG